MKLSNQQIDALLSVLEKNHNDKNKKLNAEKIAAAEKKVMARAKTLLKMYESLPQELKQIIGNYNKPTMNSIIKKLTGKVQLIEFNRSDLRNKIVLASIDATSLEDLKTKLKISY